MRNQSVIERHCHCHSLVGLPCEVYRRVPRRVPRRVHPDPKQWSERVGLCLSKVVARTQPIPGSCLAQAAWSWPEPVPQCWSSRSPKSQRAYGIIIIIASRLRRLMGHRGWWMDHFSSDQTRHWIRRARHLPTRWMTWKSTGCRKLSSRIADRRARVVLQGQTISTRAA